ncbi:hypothetical protein NQZ68_026767 [Dissostichus eleginoides]|nr:hypothetical protein NQZ68_026767 [Dissostichus eleginoides]
MQDISRQAVSTDVGLFIPRFQKLHSGWKVGHKKRGQQLTSLWLNIKHTVGLHFVLQEEGQGQGGQNGSVCQVTLLSPS